MANDNNRKFSSVIVDGVAPTLKENRDIFAKYGRLVSPVPEGAVADKF